MLLAPDRVYSESTCNTEAMENLLVNSQTERKENSLEPTLSTVTPLSSKSSDFKAEGICGKIWTDAEGSCCKQSELQNRADTLIKKLQMRMSARYHSLNNGNDKILNRMEELETKVKANNSNTKSSTDPSEVDWIGLIAGLKDVYSRNQQDKNDALDNMKTCIKAVADYRIKSWCLSCAAFNGASLKTENFYSRGRIQVQQPVCEDLIDKCAQVMTYFRKIRAADAILRKLRKSVNGSDKEGVSSDIESNSQEKIEVYNECSKDISACKSDQTKRENFCNYFQMNIDEDKLWGDGKLLQVSLDEIGSRLLGSREASQLKTNQRILEKNTDYQGIIMVNQEGLDMTALTANYQVSEDQFKQEAQACILSISAVLALLYYFF